MKWFFGIFFFFSFCFQVAGQDAKHPGTLKTVIIDTDCGLDDLWALSILLSRPEIQIKAVIVSEGCLSPAEGALKVAALLHTFNADSIMIATGKSNAFINPTWRTFCSQLSWGKAKGIENVISLDAFYKTLETPLTNKFTFVCLGSLTSVESARMNYASVFKQIDRIIWYNTSAIPLKGFNYACDTLAAQDIIQNGKIRIDVVTNPHNAVLFDQTCYQLAQLKPGKLSEIIKHVYAQPLLEGNLTHTGKKSADELVALYLLSPELFTVNCKVSKPRLQWVESFETLLVKEMLGDIITGDYTGERSVVFNAFPSNRAGFNYDVRQIIDSAIQRYGHDEWKACVMTDEFHGHLGVFSIVGAKMGIKAREIFGVGPDQLSVVSYAGLRPPYSCLTDGIQVSTGATLGQGLIQVSADSMTLPSAVFSYKGRSVRITLKSEYLKMIESDIETGILKFGLADDGYWKLVRKAALNYWVNWNRNEIFEMEECKL